MVFMNAIHKGRKTYLDLILFLDPNKTVTYLYHFQERIKGPCLTKFLEVIYSNHASALDYVIKVKRAPCVDLETMIISEEDSWACLTYACFVLERRWPEAEEIILKDEDVAIRYTSKFISKARRTGTSIDENESALLDTYCRTIIGYRVAKFERKIAIDRTSLQLYVILGLHRWLQ